MSRTIQVSATQKIHHTNAVTLIYTKGKGYHTTKKGDTPLFFYLHPTKRNEVIQTIKRYGALGSHALRSHVPELNTTQLGQLIRWHYTPNGIVRNPK